MGLDFAIDALYETGWSGQGSITLQHVDGRRYPSIASIQMAFVAAGFELFIKHIQLFDCYRAEWRDDQHQIVGAVVGQSAEESAVYAFSQLRKQYAHATV